MKLNYPNCLLGLLLCFSFLSYAQVGVNTTNPQAQLDVVATNPSLPSNTDGFLVPRIDVFPVTNPTATQQGMLVYLTTAVGVNQPGFYFWDNTTITWKPISSTSTSVDWSLTGNSGTTSGTNFIGTTDNQSLDIRTNNAIKVRITSKGQIEILNTGDSVFIGQNAGLNDDLTNNENVFIGQSAGQNNTIGSSNVGVGKQSLLNTTSSNNTALGNYSGESLTTGFNNSIFGESAMRNSVSNFRNVAVGSSALRNNISGNENTVLGSEAGRNNIVGSGNVFIGNQAGQDETTSNKLYIDNSSTTNPLIYGDFASNLLRVNGTLNINNTYNLPTTDGTANQILQTNGAGNVTWITPAVVAETDPQVSSSTTNYIPKWNGTTLVDGQVFDDGTNIGVGTITPSSKVHVVGNIKVDSGKIPFVNTGGSVFIGDNAGLNDDLSSNVNTYVGTNAGRNNTVGSGNVAIGLGASQATTLGLQNVALGSNSLRNNLVGSSNTVVGTFAGENATGSSNLFLGYTTGQFATGNANVFIGNSAGQNETGSNKLYIDNSNTVNPLLYGDFTTNLLRVNGTLNVNNAYNLPTTAGTVNQVLQTDGAGNSSWVNPTTLANNSWSLTGNSGTILGTNFIGSIDDVQLSFRVNNSRSGLISNSTTSSTFFGYQAGGTGTANNNSAFGHQALNGLTNGNNNTANGYQSLFSNTNGINNTALGYRTLYNNVSGNQNVAIGNQALNSNSGSTNTAIGSSSMFSNTTGNSNVSSGFNAMYGNISGSQNVGLGTESLMSNTSGGNNVAVGYRALYSNTITFNNNAVGSGSLQNNATGSLNNAFGTGALFTNTSGNNNVAFGHQAGYLSTGNRNVFLGYSAGYNETGNDKLYIDNSNTVNPLIYGDFGTDLLRVNGTLNVNNAYDLPTTSGTANQVLQTNGAGVASWVNPSSLTITETDPQVTSTTTNRVPKWNGTSLVDGQVFDNGTNVGVGTVTPTDKVHIVGNVKIDGGKLPFVNTGQSVFIGENSGLNDDLTANQNVFIGWESGKLNTSGNLNTFIGHGSGMVNNTGSANSAFGQFALGSNTTGSNNNAIGRAALSRSTSGTFNTAIGYSALENNTIGTYNVSIGDSSLGSNLTGNFNTALGSGAGYNNNGSYNVFLGVDAGFNETGSNKLYIDNTNTNNPLIYGDFATNLLKINGILNVNNAYNLPTNSGTADQVLQTDGAGNTSWVNPSTLTVTETDPQVSSSVVNYVPRWIGTTLDDGSIQDDGTSIGIATAPLAGNRVTVNGKTSTTNLQISNGASNGFVLQSDALGNGTWVNSSTLTVTENDPQISSTTTNFIPKWNGATLIDGLIYNGASNIGVGTSAPSEKLHLFGGNMLIDRGTAVGGTSRKLTVEGARGSTGASFAQIDLNNYDTDTASSYTGASIQSHNTQSTEDGDLRFFTNNGTLTERMSITNNGNVGIGTSVPSQALLVVNGSASTTLTAYGYLNNTPTPAGYLFAAATNNYSIYASNHIAASEFNAFSDARIKNIKGISNGKLDLETLSKIEITNYTLKDSISKGNNNYKKVIAQQVEKVYPQAVSKLTDVVPDIYQQAEMMNGFIELENNLKSGEKIKIITKSDEQIVEVLEANSKGFKIDSNQTEKIFVYGRQVNDFRSVDYEALSTLNISATQELLKRIERLEAENKVLKQQINAFDQLNAEVESIKNTLLQNRL